MLNFCWAVYLKQVNLTRKCHNHLITYQPMAPRGREIWTQSHKSRGKFNNASALKRLLYWCQALHITNKDRYRTMSARERSHCWTHLRYTIGKSIRLSALSSTVRWLLILYSIITPYDPGFWRLWIIMYLKILWKMEHLLQKEQMLHFP